jgi:hypothetical protein
MTSSTPTPSRLADGPLDPRSTRSPARGRPASRLNDPRSTGKGG